MELGLSLGGENPSKPFGFTAKANGSSENQNHPNNTNNKDSSSSAKLGLGFCMALGINNNSNETRESRRNSESKDNDGMDADADDVDEDDDRTSSEHTRDDDDRRRGISVDTPLQLNLLPLAPVPRRTPIHTQPLRWSSDNGSSGSSGNVGLPVVGRGFDVNRVPAVGGVAEEVSSPNSVASSFQMDFSIFRGGGNLGNGGNKRDFGAAAGNDVVEAERTSSRASDEDENGLNTRKKLRLSKEQSAYLEESFKEHNTLNPKQKLALAKQLNLRPRQVEVWFQNRRARTKLKQTEVDCEYLKRCCETLTDENRRLHKELQELRALKTSNPFYMQLPATTLTMCPSCERVATTSTTTAAAAAPVPSTTTTTTTTPATNVKSTTTATTTTSDNAPKAIPFPISRPRFYPFAAAAAAAAHTNHPHHHHHHHHQSAAS
ncbi:homeobox-leucine zipper protein HOX11-like [Coffea eugenioides]|uniref:homeobox-leucine zipper protein HOX11-like n=1 Tax=Coffea eugenioides TaxID=49369 RepID=UPI000F606279|nr:homeobox-leucine zipper protein HOX11-like [Coffea eugenioides]